MKRHYKIVTGKGIVEKEYVHIPIRYLIAVIIAVIEILVIIGIVLVLCYYLPIFYALCIATSVVCVINIIASDDNPDYKAPWLIAVMLLPIVGSMLYFMFYSRKLSRRLVKRMNEVMEYRYEHDDKADLDSLREEDVVAYSQAKMLTEIAHSHIFKDCGGTYFSSGESMRDAMLSDLESAERFILLEYFIIEDGEFWSSVFDVLKRKAKAGVDVRVVYDDIGCMKTLPGNYDKLLRKHGIKCVIFSKLRGSADSEFNNRNHRKILVIDGRIGYTGGVNIADEYINRGCRLGHWKDGGIRLTGDAVKELTRLALSDFGLNSKVLPSAPDGAYPDSGEIKGEGYLIPFGDGPRPIYRRHVSKCAIQNMIGSAVDRVYMTTPYLIIDNDLCADIERAALRGVDVRIIVPHVPDKRIVFAITRSFYPRLMDAGVKIYEYEPGFIHSKTYVADGKYAIVGTVNLDYRSLVHHFENGVWMYRTDAVRSVEEDIAETLEHCIRVTTDMLKRGPLSRLVRSFIRIFAPMM